MGKDIRLTGLQIQIVCDILIATDKVKGFFNDNQLADAKKRTQSFLFIGDASVNFLWSK